MADGMTDLRRQLTEVAALKEAAMVLEWDMETYMPSGGFAGRGELLAHLQSRAHALFTGDETGRLLEAAESQAASLSYESDGASLVRVTRRDYERERKVPAALVAEMAAASTAAVAAWRGARANADFAAFAPHLQKNVELSRRRAEAIGYSDRPFDALLYDEPGMTAAKLDAVFNQLKDAIVPLVRAISEHADRVSAAPLHGDFPEDVQAAFAERVIRAFGFDFDRGRVDRSAHPFMLGINPGDVRLTNRFDPEFLQVSLFGLMHESGHGMYGQGHAADLFGTPLWDGASPGMHESQSRLYENLVGRSRPFWRHWYPELQRTFPEALGRVDEDRFYAAVNQVSPSLIRVEADEVTYNLHILLRCEIESELLEDRLRVDEVPAAWSARMEEYLGVEPRNAAEGPLQDIHWTFAGSFASFPGYTIGNLISAQLMEAIRRAIPDLDAQLEAGEYSALLAWLRDKVHRHGRKFTPSELLERAVGGDLDAGPWIAYVRSKFGELYGLG